jgi:3-isopropylmalate/(R)-2-methylmalate dehydratase small subunit
MTPSRALVVHAGLVAPFDRSNIDTDAIIPKAFLKSIQRTGLGRHLFDSLRYSDPYREDATDAELDARRELPDFVLNQHPYRYATILLARANFGCGSSREHALWALSEFGFRVIVAESFADIFHGNAVRNGLLTVALPATVIDALFRTAANHRHMSLAVDLREQILVTASGEIHPFSIAASHREQILQGLDEIGGTLARADTIKAFENRRRQAEPWV